MRCPFCSSKINKTLVNKTLPRCPQCSASLSLSARLYPFAAADKLIPPSLSFQNEFHPGVVIGNVLTLLVSAALLSYPHFAHIGEVWMLSLRAGGGVLLGLALLSLLISRCGTIWDTLPPWQRWLALPGIWGWAAALLVILSIFLIRFLDSLDFDFGGSDSSGKKKKR